MKQKIHLPLRRTKQGFLQFIKCDFPRLKYSISSFEKYFVVNEENIQEYAEALEINRRFEGFIYTLTDLEKDAIKYLRYHGPDDKMPKDYWSSLDAAYEKWLRVFSEKSIRSFLEIDAEKLGRLMKKIRTTSFKSSIETAEILGIDRVTLFQYEHGKRLPQINTLYRFCVLFNTSMDLLVENTLK